MMKQIGRLLVAGLILLVVGGFAYYFTKPSLVSKGTLVVGTDATYPPLESVVDGKLTGFDIELAGALVGEMGYKIDLKNVPFDDIFKEMDGGKIDLVVSSVTITAERRKTMLFSSPYLNAGQVVVVKSDNQTITGVNDLKGIRVGVQKGTTSEEEAIKYAGKAFTIPLADYDKAKSEMLVGQIEAMILDYPAAVGMSNDSQEKFKIVGKPFTSEYYGVVLPIGKEKLMGRVNEALSSLKRKGVIDRLETKWLKK